MEIACHHCIGQVMAAAVIGRLSGSLAAGLPISVHAHRDQRSGVDNVPTWRCFGSSADWLQCWICRRQVIAAAGITSQTSTKLVVGVRR